MTESSFHLAQANIARMLAPLESPVMEGFRSQLEAVNAAADRSRGFVWRLQTEEGDATAVRAFDDELVLFNMSVWTSLNDLRAYVYRGIHVGPLRERALWFTRLEPSLVLWWVTAGHEPTIEEARAKLDLLRERGPTPDAFTFQEHFPPPAAGGRARGAGFGR